MTAAAVPSGYRLSASINEDHQHPIYCVAFSPAEHTNDDDGSKKSALKYFSTCAGQYVHIYEISNEAIKNEKRLMVRQVYCDVDEEEEFYTCAFGGKGFTEGKSNASNNNKSKPIYIGDNKRSKSKKRRRENDEDDNRIHHDLSQRQGPPLLCVAGQRGIIKVIDTVLQSLVITLVGHGDSVNDLKCSPANESLLLSASKDHSIRLWNLQYCHMIAIFAGHDGHRGEVLSLSWHYSGAKFASSAFDNTIKLWNVSDDKLTAGNSEKEGPIQVAIRKSFEIEPDDKIKTVIEQTPYFSTDSIHDLPGCVDCVQFVGDLVLSKSVQNVIVLWQPVVTNEDFEAFNTIYPNYINENRKSNDRIKSKVIFLRDFTVNNCDNWFIRFGTSSPYNEILAMGNQNGEVRVWKLMGGDDDEEDQEFFNGSNEGLLCKELKTGGSTVRMVAIAGTECLVAVCDDSSIWMFEAIES